MNIGSQCRLGAGAVGHKIPHQQGDTRCRGLAEIHQSLEIAVSSDSERNPEPTSICCQQLQFLVSSLRQRSMPPRGPRVRILLPPAANEATQRLCRPGRRASRTHPRGKRRLRSFSAVKSPWQCGGLNTSVGSRRTYPYEFVLNGGIFWRYNRSVCDRAWPHILRRRDIFADVTSYAGPGSGLGLQHRRRCARRPCRVLFVVLGFPYVLFLAMGFYLLSAWAPRLQKAQP
jgi:hypothetical protein